MQQRGWDLRILCPQVLLLYYYYYIMSSEVSQTEKGKYHMICLFLRVLCLVTQSCLTLIDPIDCSLSGSSVFGGSPGKNTGVGFHALLQGIFPTQGMNLGLPRHEFFTV